MTFLFVLVIIAHWDAIYVHFVDGRLETGLLKFPASLSMHEPLLKLT